MAQAAGEPLAEAAAPLDQAPPSSSQPAMWQPMTTQFTAAARLIVCLAPIRSSVADASTIAPMACAARSVPAAASPSWRPSTTVPKVRLVATAACERPIATPSREKFRRTASLALSDTNAGGAPSRGVVSDETAIRKCVCHTSEWRATLGGTVFFEKRKNSLFWSCEFSGG